MRGGCKGGSHIADFQLPIGDCRLSISGSQYHQAVASGPDRLAIGDCQLPIADLPVPIDSSQIFGWELAIGIRQSAIE